MLHFWQGGNMKNLMGIFGRKDNGNSKYSVTQYPNGTVVETKVTKQK
jgi:hypothetical protein